MNLFSNRRKKIVKNFLLQENKIYDSIFFYNLWKLFHESTFIKFILWKFVKYSFNKFSLFLLKKRKILCKINIALPYSFSPET